MILACRSKLRGEAALEEVKNVSRNLLYPVFFVQEKALCPKCFVEVFVGPYPHVAAMLPNIFTNIPIKNIM